MQAQSTLQVIAAIAKYRLIAAVLRELMLRRAWSLAARVWIWPSLPKFRPRPTFSYRTYRVVVRQEFLDRQL